MRRPTSVIVFGYLNVVFGALAIISSVFTLSTSSFASSEGEVFTGTPMFSLQVSNAIASVVLLVSGLGLLRLKPWGRKLSIAYAIYTILVTIVGTVYAAVFVLPMLEESAATGSNFILFAMIGMGIGFVISMLHPGLLLFFMTRLHVVAAFTGKTLPSQEAGFDTAIAPQPFSGNPYAAPVTLQSSAGDRIPDRSETVLESVIPIKNRPALAAYYLGLFSLFPVLGLPLAVVAIVLGRKGLRKIRESPEVKGTVHAWVGIVCGTLFGLMNIGIVGLAIAALVAFWEKG